ncbi:MAG: endolytic transglycosylase MltG [Clostridia bacterium]|nr:endolytic transglycosylase MltG [Clostridia bacterium]
MNKKLLFPIAALLILAFICFFAAPVVMDIANIPVSKNGGEVLITIADGTSTLGIGSILSDNNLIRNKFSFLIKVKSSKYNGKLNSGTYTLSSGMTMEEIAEVISRPQLVKETVTITFPEGYTIEQMSILLEEKGIVEATGFLDALDEDYDYQFLKEIPDADYNYKLQGFLFPDTYEFYKNSTPHEVIDRMLGHFEEMYLGCTSDYQNVFEIITKASMIEKEAKLESERPIVAGVIENRTRNNMPYQIDACVLYAATNGLFDKDASGFISQNIRKLDSPYNTYMYSGLPVGPICNPGITSIRAALNPQSHNYLYYHTDTDKNDGSHIFTETYNEHLNTMN